MSEPAWEVASSFANTIDHLGSNWKTIPGRWEIAVITWQQAYTQSLSVSGDGSGPGSAACDAPEKWPQQSWGAHVLPDMSIMPTATRRVAIPYLHPNRRNMAEELSQMSLKEVNNRCPAPVVSY